MATEDEKKAAADAAAAEQARADAQAKDDQARMDAEAGEKLDKVLSCLDSVAGRLDRMDARIDSFEDLKKNSDAKKDTEGDEKDKDDKKADSKRKDAEGDEKEKEKEKDAKADKRRDEDLDEDGKPKKVVADKRKDAEGDEKDKDAKADSKRKDDFPEDARVDARADSADLRRRLDDITARLPKPQTDADYAATVDAQARADSVHHLFGGAAPRPLSGETALAYRRRLARGLQPHSPTWKDVDLGAIADAAAFAPVETQIYADAQSAALKPADLPEGQLRSFTRADSTGRQITTFVGEPRAWMRSFGAHRRRLVGIRNSVS